MITDCWTKQIICWNKHFDKSKLSTGRNRDVFGNSDCLEFKNEQYQQQIFFLKKKEENIIQTLRFESCLNKLYLCMTSNTTSKLVHMNFSKQYTNAHAHAQIHNTLYCIAQLRFYNVFQWKMLCYELSNSVENRTSSSCQLFSLNIHIWSSFSFVCLFWFFFSNRDCC